MALTGRVTDLYGYEEVSYGFAVSLGNKRIYHKYQAELPLSGADAYGVLFYNLVPGTQYKFIQYVVYRNEEGKEKTVYGDVFSHTTK